MQHRDENEPRYERTKLYQNTVDFISEGHLSSIDHLALKSRSTDKVPRPVEPTDGGGIPMHMALVSSALVSGSTVMDQKPWY